MYVIANGGNKNSAISYRSRYAKFVYFGGSTGGRISVNKWRRDQVQRRITKKQMTYLFYKPRKIRKIA